MLMFAGWKGLVPGEMLSLALLVWSCPFVSTSEVPTWACRSISRDARNLASVFRAVSRTSPCLVLAEGRAGSAPEGRSCFSYTQPSRPCRPEPGKTRRERRDRNKMWESLQQAAQNIHAF